MSVTIGAMPHFSMMDVHTDQMDAGLRRAHIAHRAGYAKHDGNVYKPKSVFDRTLNVIAGSNATDRYLKAYTESNQRAALAVIAEKYNAKKENRVVNFDELAKSRYLKFRTKTDDFVRFAPGLRKALDSKLQEKSDEKVAKAKAKGQSKDPSEKLQWNSFDSIKEESNWRARWSQRCVRFAHKFDGLNELCAAPTGTMTGFATTFFSSGFKLHDLRRYARLITTLGAATFAVSILGGFLINGPGSILGRSLLAVGLSPFAVIGVACWDGVSGTMALGGLISSMIGKLLRHGDANVLSEVVQHVDVNRQRYLARLLTLIKEDMSSVGGREMVHKALKKEGNQNAVKLIDQLCNDVKNLRHNDDFAMAQLENSLGKYLTNDGQLHFGVEKSKNAGLWARVKGRLEMRQMTQRESDVVAITCLIEHGRMDKHMAGSEAFDNIRTGIDRSLREKRAAINGEVVEGSGGYTRGELIAQQEATRKAVTPCSVDHVIENPHQYRPWVRFAVKVIRSLHCLSFDVFLSTNGMITRPFAALARQTSRFVTGGLCSWSTSWHFGRVCSAAVWAGLWIGLAMLLSPAASAIVLSTPETSQAFKDALSTVISNNGLTVLGLGVLGSVGAKSTGLQMFALSGLGGLISTGLQSVLRMGWAGDSAAPVSSYDATFGPHKERALAW